MNWRFAIINGELAEIYFEKRKKSPKFLGHAIVKIEEFKTKKEQKMIREDMIKHQFIYDEKDHSYTRINFEQNPEVPS